MSDIEEYLRDQADNMAQGWMRDKFYEAANEIARLKGEVQKGESVLRAWQARAVKVQTELATLQAAHQWQPIETAPKDGTWVLCFGEVFDDGGDRIERQIFTAQFSDFLNGRRLEKGRWMFAWYDGGYYGNCEPTHWMPLPEARGDKA